MLLAELKRTRASMNALMVEAIEMAQKVFPEAEPQPEFVVAGETNLMGVGQVADVETLKGLFEAFGRQRDILHLLDQSMKAEGVQIFIGHESGYELLDSYSIVAAPYVTERRYNGRSRRHRSHPHGLRARHPDRRHHGQIARPSLEVQQLVPICEKLEDQGLPPVGP